MPASILRPVLTGPAASPEFLPATHPSNPYNFSTTLVHATRLPPKVTETHVFFFSHEGTDPLTWLSQWYPSPFHAPKPSYDSSSSSSPSPQPTTHYAETLLLFPTAEHYMMYHKAPLIHDESIAAQILLAPHPSTAKTLGRQVRNFDGELWSRHAQRVVEEANTAKFGQSQALRRVLLQETGERVLVEASPEDRIWGIGFNAEEAEGREAEWGQNLLGKVLMKVRERLGGSSQEEEKESDGT